MTADEDPRGVDVDAVTEWFTANAPGVEPPLDFDLVVGGHSNLTYVVSDARNTRWVLRRPPLGHVLATAHDVGREHTIISALSSTDVPVPPAVGMCTDEAVNGAPFYVMDFVDGYVLRDQPAAEAMLDDAGRKTAGADLIDVLARIHSVDPDAVGLGDLGRKDGYLARQLSRWQRQWSQSKSRDVPEVDEAHNRLVAWMPEQGAPSIVHGDYRLDNCIVGPDGRIQAVLDWELCTLGDPLADLGITAVYWTEPGDEFAKLRPSPTTAPGFAGRAELIAGYADRTGRDVSQIAYYEAFAYWRLACILEGVATRYRAGVMGQAPGEDRFAGQVEWLGRRAVEALDRLA